MDCHWEWIATLTLNDDDDHGLSLQNGWPTNPSLSMKPAGTFVEGFHHRKSPRHREKYLNLFRTWVQILMNKNVKAAVTNSTQLHYNRMSLTHFSPVLNFIKTPVIKIQLWAEMSQPRIWNDFRKHSVGMSHFDLFSFQSVMCIS